MFRAAILIPLLITSLLACPLKCMGAMQASTLPAAACCCCHDDCRDRAEADRGTSESGPNSGAPDSSAPVDGLPADDCACPSCLCNGALLGADDGVDLEPLCESFYAAASAIASASTTAMGAEPAAASTDAVPLHVTGRSVRIAHQSFLL